MVAYLRSLVDHNPDPDHDIPLKKLLLSSTSKPLNALELGSGCGIVGIALSQLLPNCNVLLTDLPEAMDILRINTEGLDPKPGSKVEYVELNWEDELSTSLSEKEFDLILISDCTYNADSLPALVKTVSRLTSVSKEAHIVVSMKVRHDSEVVFFDLMSKAGLRSIRHDTVILPDKTRNEDELDKIEVYDFRLEDIHDRP